MQIRILKGDIQVNGNGRDTYKFRAIHPAISFNFRSSFKQFSDRQQVVYMKPFEYFFQKKLASIQSSELIPVAKFSKLSRR